MSSTATIGIPEGPLITYPRRRRPFVRVGLALAGLVFTTGGCAPRPWLRPWGNPSPSPSSSSTDLPYANFPDADWSSPCKLVDDMFDPDCTPGAVDPTVTQANIQSTICRTGYTEEVRPSTSITRLIEVDVIKQYNLPGTPANWVLDHNVNLGLGGQRYNRNPNGSIAKIQPNLGPQKLKVSQRKDIMENRIRRLVCAGVISLAEGQLAYDWRDSEKKYPESMVPKRKGLPKAEPDDDVTFENCAEVRRAGRAPIKRGQPGFGEHLDGNDNDGIGCE